jgi:hypothetical protein
LRTSARNFALLLSLAVAASFSCSKTQDTAPERRIFGEPPIIQSVDPDYFAQEAPALCDFSDVVFALFCQNGILDVEPQTGFGWTVLFDDSSVPPTRIIKKETVESTIPGILITGVYSELNFKASVVDPNSTPASNNVLLVSSSYVAPSSVSETSLVLFDDGSDTNFKLEQESLVAEDCDIDIPNGTCTCTNAVYDIQSGDAVKDDGTWTRRFVLINPNVSGFLNDCIMRSRHVFGIPAAPGTAFNFKIEAVDRQGNLTVWPTTLPAVTGDSRFACTGDSCGCCLLHAFSQQADLPECKGEPGMISPSQYPNGFCVDAL